MPRVLSWFGTSPAIILAVCWPEIPPFSFLFSVTYRSRRGPEISRCGNYTTIPELAVSSCRQRDFPLVLLWCRPGFHSISRRVRLWGSVILRGQSWPRSSRLVAMEIGGGMNRTARIGILSLSVIIFCYAGLGHVLGHTPDDKAYKSLTVYSEVLHKIQDDYVDEPNVH